MFWPSICFFLPSLTTTIHFLKIFPPSSVVTTIKVVLWGVTVSRYGGEVRLKLSANTCRCFTSRIISHKADYRTSTSRLFILVIAAPVACFLSSTRWTVCTMLTTVGFGDIHVSCNLPRFPPPPHTHILCFCWCHYFVFDNLSSSFRHGGMNVQSLFTM